MAAKLSKPSESKTRKMLFKALKAAVKGLIILAIYFILWQFFSPVSEFIPGFQLMVETFVTIYIILVIISELASGTIFHHFFNASKALYVIVYLMLSLESGFFELTANNVSLIIDLRLFLMVAMLLSLLGLAKSVLQAINYMNENSEVTYRQ